MKKGCVLLLLLVLFMPAASALIQIEEPSKNIKHPFNIGDKIHISGFISNLPEVDGLFQSTAECSKASIPFLPTKVMFGQDKKTFPTDIGVKELIAQESMEGTCKIRIQALTKDRKLIEEAESPPFEVSKSLDGTFEKQLQFKVQLGKSLTITGRVINLKGDYVNGQATVYFNDNTTKYPIGEVDVKEGIVEFEFSTSSNPPGLYFVDVFVKDHYGNEHPFEGVASFLLIDELYISAKLDEEKIMPGSSFTVKGESTAETQEGIEEADVELLFDSEKYATALKDSKFEIEVDTKKNIKSGEHNITINVRDKFGNYGTVLTNIFIQQVVTALTNSFKKELNPDESFEFESSVTDQGGDSMKTEVSIELINPEGEVASSQNVQSSEKVVLKMPQFAAPGMWKLKAKADSISAKDEFSVKKVENLSVEIEGNKLIIKNIGNVKHNGQIELDIDGVLKDYELVKRGSIGVNETFVVDLEKEVPKGDYDVKVPEIQGEFIGNVSVKEGKSRLKFDFGYIGLAILSIFLMVLLMKTRLKLKQPFYPRQKAKKNEAKEPQKIVYGQSKDADVEDFKKRVFAEMERIEKREAQHPQQKPEDQQPKEGGGLFSMFK